MAALSDAESATQLEAMCNEDSSWHPCRLSLSSTEDSLIVSFGRQELEDMVLNKDEALMRLRFRSAPILGDDCSHIEGQHVLCIHKSPFKSYLYDAKVVKVTRVKHSTRVYCRCTFMIQWLHQDLKGKMFTVSSSSIMKLASRSIKSHPAVAALLKAKQMGLHTAPPFPIMHEQVNVEFDLNKILGEQIDRIDISADGFTNEMSVDILEGVKVDDNGHVDASKAGFSRAQISDDQGQFRSVKKRSADLEVNKEHEDPQAPFASKQELHSGHRTHISPLAARAALASLVSLTHKHIAISGTELFNSSDRNNVSIKISSDTTKSPIKGILNSSGARTTRSTVQKGFGKVFETQNSDLHNSAEASKLRALTNTRRLTRSAVKEEKDNLSMVDEQGLQESNSAHNAESYSSEENAIFYKIKEAISSPFHSESKIPKASDDFGAIQDAYDQMKICAKDTKSSISTNARRLTRSSVSSKENPIVLDSSHVLEKESGEAKNTKAASLSSQNDSRPSEENYRKHTSDAVRILRNSPQSEGQSAGKMTGSGGSSQGKKRNSTSSSKQEQRFSPRLRSLPCTRS